MHAHLFLPQSPWGANVTIVLIFHFLQPVVWWLQNAVHNETSVAYSQDDWNSFRLLREKPSFHMFSVWLQEEQHQFVSPLVHWSVSPTPPQDVPAMSRHQVDVLLLYLDNGDAAIVTNPPTAPIRFVPLLFHQQGRYREFTAVCQEIGVLYDVQRGHLFDSVNTTLQWSHRGWAGWWKYAEQALRIVAGNKIMIGAFSLLTFCSFTQCAPRAKCCQGPLDWSSRHFYRHDLQDEPEAGQANRRRCIFVVNWPFTQWCSV